MIGDLSTGRPVDPRGSLTEQPSQPEELEVTRDLASPPHAPKSEGRPNVSVGKGTCCHCENLNSVSGTHRMERPDSPSYALTPDMFLSSQ